MIHDLVLPPVTKERLFALVRLQVALLEYAASVTGNNIRWERCIDHLNKEDSFFKGYGEQITRALRQAPTRVRLLQDFSLSIQAADDSRPKYNDPTFKQSWLKRIRNDIENLASPKEEQLKIFYFYGDGKEFLTAKARRQEEAAPSWQQKAGEFFLYFYEEYLGNSDQTFPLGFFPSDATTGFGRQALLRAFLDCNEDLHICPVCDENGYYTKSKETINTTLDHYLPKDIYPHFACHPYNLIPTCYACNSSVKGIKDPLHTQLGETGPGYLHRGTIPYAPLNRKENVYLKVDLSKGIDAIRIIGLLPRQGLKDADEQGLHSTLELLQRLYDIPGRWSEEKKRLGSGRENKGGKKRDETSEGEKAELSIAADRVSEALFRRMRHFLGQGRDIIPGSHMVDELFDVLALLLYYLSEEDRYKDPLTVPMLWILAALLTQEKHQLQKISEMKKKGEIDKESHLIPAALNEVLSWCGQNKADREKREKRVEEILALVIEQK